MKKNQLITANSINIITKSIYQKAFQCSPIGQLLIDRKHRIIIANMVMCHYFSVNANPQGKHFGNAFNCYATNKNKMLCGQSRRCPSCEVYKALRNIFNYNAMKGKYITIPYWYYTEKGYHCKWMEFYIESVYLDGQRCVLMNCVDVSKHIKDKIKLSSRLKIDLATGALNKYSLMIKINNLLHRNENKISFTACMTDFDDFKYINDTYGH